LLLDVQSLEGHTVTFEEKRGENAVQYDGVPFIMLGNEVRGCHQGPQ